MPPEYSNKTHGANSALDLFNWKINVELSNGAIVRFSPVSISLMLAAGFALGRCSAPPTPCPDERGTAHIEESLPDEARYSPVGVNFHSDRAI